MAMNEDKLRRLADEIDEQVDHDEAVSCLFAGKPFLSFCLNREACLRLGAMLLKLATAPKSTQANGKNNWRQSPPMRQIDESGSYRIHFIERVDDLEEPDQAEQPDELRPRDKIASFGCVAILALTVFLMGSGVWHWMSWAFSG